MPIVRVTQKLAKNSGIERDAVVNVWHFFHPLPLDLGTTNKIMFGVQNFYDAITPHYSEAIDRGATSLTTLTKLTPGGAGVEDDVVSAVVQQYQYSPLAKNLENDEGPLPNEIAVCLSYMGESAGVPEESGMTRPRARRRGRVFLGPFGKHVVANVPVTDEPKVSAALMTTILEAYEALITYIQSVTGTFGTTQHVAHVLYSPTSGLEWPVVRAWVDSDFDVMRSRGVRAAGFDFRDITQTVELL